MPPVRSSATDAIVRDLSAVHPFRGIRRHFFAHFRLAAITFASLALVGLVAHVAYSVQLFARETALELYVIGTELVDGGDYPKAIETLHRAAYVDPTDARIYVELGNAYYYEGADAEARAAWDQAIRLDPKQEQGRIAAGLPRPVRRSERPPPAPIHADPEEVWSRSWHLSLGGFDRSRPWKLLRKESRSPSANVRDVETLSGNRK